MIDENFFHRAAKRRSHRRLDPRAVEEGEAVGRLIATIGRIGARVNRARISTPAARWTRRGEHLDLGRAGGDVAGNIEGVSEHRLAREKTLRARRRSRPHRSRGTHGPESASTHATLRRAQSSFADPSVGRIERTSDHPDDTLSPTEIEICEDPGCRSAASHR
jgi:hypothetical protein